MLCPICDSKKTIKIFKDFQGYVEGTNFDIYKCNWCNSHFISTKAINKNIYDLIYNNSETPGYEAHLIFAKKVMKKKDPLQFLFDEKETCFPVYKCLKDKSNLSILEVGCGYGYLTYALNSSGHKAEGIDISECTISFALSHYGKPYKKTDIESYDTTKRYDLIIVTEVIEHLQNPVKFLIRYSKFLRKNGKIIITTPNKDFNNRSVWQTDLPPVHTVWLSKRSFECIADKINLDIEFVDLREQDTENENRLLKFLNTRHEKVLKPVMNEKGELYTTKNNIIESQFRKTVKRLIYSFPVKYCNKVDKIINKECRTIGVILCKKDVS